MRQTGGDFLDRYKATLFGQGGSVDSMLWGLRTGLKTASTNLSLSYDKLEDHSGSFGGGSIVSPYGDYTAMFAGVMANNLLGYGPGEVLQLACVRSFFGKHLKIKTAVMRFRTTHSGDPTAFYIDSTYVFGGVLKGLSLRERLAWSNGAASAGGRSLVYNRVMMQYAF